MLRKSVVLLSLALAIPGVSIAQGEKAKSSTNGIVNVFPNCAQLPANLDNLVQNCGFESGDFANWVQSGDTSFTEVSPDAAHSGTFGARFGPVNDLGFIAQRISTIPGQLYNLSFWLVSSGRPNRFQVYWGGVLISDSMNFPDTVTPSAIPNSPAYDQLFIGGLPGGSGSFTELKFGFFNVPYYFFLDDIVVVPMTAGASSN
jgi:hypothetical protein